MTIRWLIGTLLFSILLFGAPENSHAQGRIALVVGNGAYTSVTPLINPPNDAADVSQSLSRLGFQVTTLTDAKFDAFRRALIEFGRAARNADMAIVFFAGHGMEITGENWLLPVDAELKNDVDVDTEAVSLRSAMLAVSNAKQLGLVVLDACRNNPFLGKMHRTGPAPALDPGLAPAEPAENVLVAYAARDGTTARDGAGRNSPYTTALLRHLETPGLEIEFLFRNVRDDVMAATNDEQQPFVYGSLSSEEIYLKEGGSPQVAYNSSRVMSDAGEIAWSFLKDSPDVGTLQRFVEVFPSSDRLSDAKVRLAALMAADKSDASSGPSASSNAVELDRLISQTARQFTNNAPAVDAAWKIIKDTKDAPVLRRFVAQYPSRDRREEVRQRLTDMGAPPPFARDALLQAAADPDVLRCYQSHDPDAPECLRAFDHYPDIWLYVSDFRFRFELCELMRTPDHCNDTVANLGANPLFLIRRNHGPEGSMHDPHAHMDSHSNGDSHHSKNEHKSEHDRSHHSADKENAHHNGPSGEKSKNSGPPKTSAPKSSGQNNESGGHPSGGMHGGHH